MTEANSGKDRPSSDQLFSYLVDDLSHQYQITNSGGAWRFRRPRTGREFFLDFTPQELTDYVVSFEDRAFAVLGVEPRWKSAVALIGVYIAETGAMLDKNTSWVVFADGKFVGARNPRG